jgi:endonuclease YncB( thermonuclease family)
MNKKKGMVLITLIVFLIFIVDYSFFDKELSNFLDEKEEINIERVIDGDTIVTSEGIHVRLLGINTPEKGEKYYNEAKMFLENLVLNKTVELEYGAERKDLYGRTLAYLILDGKNINAEQVRNGFANFYIYDIDRHTGELKEAWKECMQKNINLCEKSKGKCVNCVVLKEIKDQKVVFENKCSFSCNLTNWRIKDEGRKNFYFGNFILDKEVSIVVVNGTDTNDILFWKGESYVWTETGDTLFLRDSEGRLVLWKEINR